MHSDKVKPGIYCGEARGLAAFNYPDVLLLPPTADRNRTYDATQRQTDHHQHGNCFHFSTSLSFLLFISSSLALPQQQSGGDAGATIRLHLPPRSLLNAWCPSSASPTGLLTGTVAVDGPRSRSLHLAGLIGREKFPCRERMSKGSVRQATGSEQLMNNYCFYRPSRGPGHNL